ncbi:MAG: sigma-70 family RNA polymerase sigma factor [Chloroflexota bacterium]
MDEALAISLAGVPDRDDAELARAATEDRAAFAAIYERHRTPVYRYLRARTATDADAQDLTATTFERAMGAIHRFQPVGGGMVAWLIRIARNAHSDAQRLQRRRGAEVANDGAEPAIDPSDDAVILRSLIDGLPREQQDAIQLRFAAGLTAREIGGVLGISEAAAQKQVERGLQALKEAYGDD